MTTIPYSPVSTTTAIAAAMTSNSGSATHSRSNGVAIGVGVGVGIGGLATILLTIVVFLKRRRYKKPASRLQISGPVELEYGGTHEITAELETSRSDEKRAHIPSTPLEMEHVPIYEMEALPDEPGRVKQDERRYPKRFSWEEESH